MRPIFKSPELARYELLRPLQESNSLVPQPDEVQRLLNQTKPDTQMPGAYAYKP